MRRRALPWHADPFAGEIAGWIALFFPVALLMGVVAWLLIRSRVRTKPKTNGPAEG